jgi:nucleotide-binding universal stress UspA family protein
MFQTILVPIDGSEHSFKALKYAAEIARRFESALILLHVYSLPKPAPISSPMPLGGPSTETPPAIEITVELIEKTKQKAQELLNRAAEKTEMHDINVQTIIKEGNAVHQIVRTAEEKNVDLIVMGARGISKLKEILMGSVSHGVTRNAHCPVLIIK